MNPHDEPELTWNDAIETLRAFKRLDPKPPALLRRMPGGWWSIQGRGRVRGRDAAVALLTQLATSGTIYRPDSLAATWQRLRRVLTANGLRTDSVAIRGKSIVWRGDPAILVCV